MVCARRYLRIAAFFLVLALLPSLAGAQESALRAPTIAASAAAAADWASTYYAVKYFHVRELNPFINQMQHEPARMISWAPRSMPVSPRSSRLTVDLRSRSSLRTGHRQPDKSGATDGPCTPCTRLIGRPTQVAWPSMRDGEVRAEGASCRRCAIECGGWGRDDHRHGSRRGRADCSAGTAPRTRLVGPRCRSLARDGN